MQETVKKYPNLPEKNAGGKKTNQKKKRVLGNKNDNQNKRFNKERKIKLRNSSRKQKRQPTKTIIKL